MEEYTRPVGLFLTFGITTLKSILIGWQMVHSCNALGFWMLGPMVSLEIWESWWDQENAQLGWCFVSAGPFVFFPRHSETDLPVHKFTRHLYFGLKFVCGLQDHRKKFLKLLRNMVATRPFWAECLLHFSVWGVLGEEEDWCSTTVVASTWCSLPWRLRKGEARPFFTPINLHKKSYNFSILCTALVVHPVLPSVIAV